MKSYNQIKDMEKVIKDDITKIIKGMILGIKPHLLFRDELINDTKRNEELFYKR